MLAGDFGDPKQVWSTNLQSRLAMVLTPGELPRVYTLGILSPRLNYYGVFNKIYKLPEINSKQKQSLKCNILVN